MVDVLLSVSVTLTTTNGNPSKSAFLEGDGSLSAETLGVREHHLPSIVDVRNVDGLPFDVVLLEYWQEVLLFCDKARVRGTHRHYFAAEIELIMKHRAVKIDRLHALVNMR